MAPAAGGHHLRGGWLCGGTPNKGGQFAIIWVDLLYEDAVPATGKLLFGEIYRLSGPDGWCDASNQDFMDLLGCSETTVRNLLKALEDVGQIWWSPGPAGKALAARSAGSSAAGNWPLQRSRRYPQKTAGTPGRVPAEI
ncbi:MAG: helix-turn-helix domain-containing protein [Oscillibacter sp.]|uniref:helix-turn-helix domain-containing protein n=1 Tax=Oscillibacter sp. TaxID=1945593 RepID=UPI001328C295|nr:helix-turn-helix domain-containing protein [Oscillibacter sp.]